MVKRFKASAVLLAVVLMLGAMAMVLTACKDEEEPEKKLVVSTMFGAGDNHNAVYTQINTEFTAATGYTIEDRSGVTTSDDWSKKVVSQVNGVTDSPDIIFYFSGSQIDSIKDKLVPLVDILKHDTSYANNNRMLTLADDYAVPIKVGSQAVMYNTDYLAAADFSTFSDMVTAISGADKAAVSPDLPHYWLNHLLVHYLYNDGAEGNSTGYEEYEAFDGTKAFFDNAERKERWVNAFYNAINTMRSVGFSEDLVTAQDENGADYFTNANGAKATDFWDGNLSVAIDGQWTAASFEAAAAKDKLEFSAFPKPAGAEKGFYIGGVTNGWYVTKTAWADESKRDAIVKYINMHTSDTALNNYCVAGGGTPANGKAITNASKAVTGFASVTYGAEQLVAIDDRMPAAAKTVLMGNWDTKSGVPMLLVKDVLEKTDVLTLLDAVIEKLS